MPKPSSKGETGTESPKKKPPKKAPESPPLEVTKHARFSSENVPRSSIKNAPYNPRKIGDTARQRLRENLATHGLLEPIIWNRRTGYIVGGHQRLAGLDYLEGTKNYLVPCAVVDLDEATEKTQNVFLNNGEAQGEWDLEALGALIKETDGADAMGFDTADVYQLFGSDVVAEKADHLIELAAAAREATAKFQRQAGAAASAKSGHYYLVVVYRDDDHRLAFTESLGLPDNRYVDGRRLEAECRRAYGQAPPQN